MMKKSVARARVVRPAEGNEVRIPLPRGEQRISFPGGVLLLGLDVHYYCCFFLFYLRPRRVGIYPKVCTNPLL